QGAQTWGGTLKYYICGPLATGQVCSDSGTSGGTLVNTLTISQNTTQPISSASGSPTAITLTSAGKYCWYVTFTADQPSHDAGVPDGNDHTGTPPADPASECFTVSPVTPSLPTTAGAGPVNFGSAVTDSAALSGAAKEPGSNGSN